MVKQFGPAHHYSTSEFEHFHQVVKEQVQHESRRYKEKLHESTTASILMVDHIACVLKKLETTTNLCNNEFYNKYLKPKVFSDFKVQKYDTFYHVEDETHVNLFRVQTDATTINMKKYKYVKNGNNYPFNDLFCIGGYGKSILLNGNRSKYPNRSIQCLTTKDSSFNPIFNCLDNYFNIKIQHQKLQYLDFSKFIYQSMYEEFDDLIIGDNICFGTDTSKFQTIIQFVDIFKYYSVGKILSIHSVHLESLRTNFLLIKIQKYYNVVDRNESDISISPSLKLLMLSSDSVWIPASIIRGKVHVVHACVNTPNSLKCEFLNQDKLSHNMINNSFFLNRDVIVYKPFYY
jgi:hypothetical protein